MRDVSTEPNFPLNTHGGPMVAAVFFTCIIVFAALVEGAMHNESQDIIRFPLYRGHATRRRLDDGGATFNEQRLGATFATHYVELYLGMPPQRSTAIVDTGSALTAVRCASCTTCGKNSNRAPYDTSKSTTGRNLTCREYPGTCRPCGDNVCYIQQTYADASTWSGFAMEERGTIGPLGGGNVSADVIHANSVTMTVACQTNVQGHFVSDIETGILGMQQGDTSILAAMVRAGRVARNAFSLCLSIDGGSFVLGGHDTALHDGSVAYTPLVRPPSNKFYSVDVLDVVVGNTSLGLDPVYFVGSGGNSFVVDSGATRSTLPSVVINRLNAVLQAVANVRFDASVMTPAVVARLPTLHLILRGPPGGPNVTLDIPPTQYILEQPAAGGGGYGLGFTAANSDTGGFLGANVLLNYDVVFDLDNQQVGFAKATCTRTAETSALNSLLRESLLMILPSDVDSTLMRPPVAMSSAPSTTTATPMKPSSATPAAPDSWTLVTAAAVYILVLHGLQR
ncbi:Aste57867_23747 [Aphanomyces stellatus]|uniref:Aste57867_23747 protein n=1 Tax=Aphanomyces stellatus TaxID=120398 RepID=A0A485LNU3_9STRA|nr:hypothetical protein As57867_023675 [Aphanomyces stellatus]VFU00392.1 Aste57867_23747 [Aphanomyces stellatus]